MPIASDDDNSSLVTALPTKPPAAPVHAIEIANASYKDVAVDTRWTPMNSLLAHVEGSSWSVDYYSQILDTHSQLSGQQTTTSSVYQQYDKICSLEFKVTSPLSQTQDSETKAMNYEGTSYVYTGVIPNEGDMFVADIGDGQLAIFRVTSTIKKSVFKKAVYEITYSISTTDADYVIDLNNKVINTYQYHKDFLNHGQNPVVIQSDSAILQTLGGTYATLCKQYFPRFFNKEFKTFTVPGQSHSIYDPFLTDYLLKMFSMEDHHLLQEVRELNVSDDEVLSQDNFWTALLNKDVGYLNSGFKRVGLVSTKSFTLDPFLNTIRYSGVAYCVYPKDPVANLQGVNANMFKTLDSVNIVEVPGGINNFILPENLKNLPSAGTLSMYPVMMDDYYVLSENFYTATDTQSVLEVLVGRYLRGESLDIGSLSDNAKLFMQWGVVEQFYYVPILLTLIRSAIRSYQG